MYVDKKMSFFVLFSNAPALMLFSTVYNSTLRIRYRSFTVRLKPVNISAITTVSHYSLHKLCFTIYKIRKRKTETNFVIIWKSAAAGWFQFVSKPKSSQILISSSSGPKNDTLCETPPSLSLGKISQVARTWCKYQIKLLWQK